MSRRTRTGTALVALLLAGVGLAPHAGAAPPYPTGSFTVQGPTTRYLGGYDLPIHAGDYRVQIDSLSPDCWIEAVHTGSPTSSNDPFEFGGYGGAPGLLRLDYPRPGTYTPRIFLTDGHGQTSVVVLPTLTLLQDPTPPTGDVTLPPAAVRGSATAWRTVTGHRADPETRVSEVRVEVMQRRNGIWWVYSTANQRWRKGTRSEAGTYATVKTALRGSTPVGADGWKQGPITGLTKGLLAIRVQLKNRGGLTTNLPVVRQYLSR